jgi:hypothetical protein
MDKRFLHTEQSFPVIKRRILFFSILLGLIYASVFYAMLYLFREVIRIFTITDTYDICILSDPEVNFYNLFFAFLSLIFAQSVCLTFWFHHPRKAFEKKHFYKTTIVNDQLSLNAIFLSWFSRLAPLYAVIIGCATKGGFYVFSLYPDYNYFFILVLIVLFLQTWVTILRVYKSKAYKWMLTSAVIISVLAFALSRVNVIDYQRLNQIFLDKNINQKYDVNLAEVETFKPNLETFELTHFYLMSDIHIVRALNPEVSDTPLILIDGKEVTFDDLEPALLQVLNRPYQSSLGQFRLFIDELIPMSYISRLKEAITTVGENNVVYAVIPKVRVYDKRYYNECFIFWDFTEQKKYENADLESFELLSVGFVKDSVQINAMTYARNQFYAAMKSQIEKHDNYLIALTVDDKMNCSDYIFVLSEIKRALATVRNDYAVKHYETEIRLWWWEGPLEREISKIIPLRMIEISQADAGKTGHAPNTAKTNTEHE